MAFPFGWHPITKRAWSIGLSRHGSRLRDTMTTGGFQQAIPFFTRELHLCSSGGVANACRVCGTDNGNDFCRMLQEPGESYCRACRTFLLCQGIEFRDDSFRSIGLLPGE